MPHTQPSVVLFGASLGGRRGYQHLKERRNILAFCDNSPKKQGTRLCGCPVLSPAQAVALQPDEVWISSMYYYEITAQLIQLGVDRKRIFMVDPSILDGYRAANKPSLSATRVLLWGVGLASQRAYNYYQSSYNILGFISTDPRFADVSFCQKPIFTPAQALKQSADCVWTPDAAFADAQKTLEPLGFPLWRLDRLPASITDTPVEPLWQLGGGFFRRKVIIAGDGPLAHKTLERTQSHERTLCFVTPQDSPVSVTSVRVLPLQVAVTLPAKKIYVAHTPAEPLLSELLSADLKGKDIEIVDPYILD